jgi:hypothetical protein
VRVNLKNIHLLFLALLSITAVAIVVDRNAFRNNGEILLFIFSTAGLFSLNPFNPPQRFAKLTAFLLTGLSLGILLFGRSMAEPVFWAGLAIAIGIVRLLAFVNFRNRDLR